MPPPYEQPRIPDDVEAELATLEQEAQQIGRQNAANQQRLVEIGRLGDWLQGILAERQRIANLAPMNGSPVVNVEDVEFVNESSDA